MFVNELRIAPVWLATLLYTLGLTFTWLFTSSEVPNTDNTRLVPPEGQPWSVALGAQTER